MILILLCYIVFLSSALLIELCILKLKELVRSSGYLQNFVCCIKMHLDKVFIKHPNICLVLKKELVCVFSTKSNQKLKSDCKMLLEEFYHIADYRSFSNHHVKLSTIFILKMSFLKNSALASFVVLSVMAATVFITALKKTPFLRQST